MTITTVGGSVEAAGGGITFEECQVGTTDWATTIAVSITAAAGNLLFVGVAHSGESVSSVAYNTGTPENFTQIDAFASTNGQDIYTGWIDVVNAGGGTTATVTFTGDDFGVAIVCEVSGFASPQLDDNDTAEEGGVAGAPNTAESTSTIADSIMFGFYGSAQSETYTNTENSAGSSPGTWTEGADYVNDPDINRGAGMVYHIFSGTGTYDHYWTPSATSNWGTGTAIFAE
ncbi:MAG: hypothetical protein GY774_35400 [Planctomycetes bacterium]|nr:hypothetical protein [Planctomycetota bacterium]